VSKFVGKPYDPALRKTKHGACLYTAWKTVRKKPHYEEWDDFTVFYNWALQSGYTIGAWLRRLDMRKPFTPDNSIWYISGESEKNIPPEWADGWNKTVNRIRKHYGMPPLEGTSYGD
jgi:hypothetical protein